MKRPKLVGSWTWENQLVATGGVGIRKSLGNRKIGRAYITTIEDTPFLELDFPRDMYNMVPLANILALIEVSKNYE